MPFTYPDNKAVDETLCNIEIDAPSQGQSATEFDLWVGAWFGSSDHPVTLPGTPVPITVQFGLRACTLRVETREKNRIPQQSRYERVDAKLRHQSQEGSETTKGAGASAAAGFDLSRFFSFMSTKAEGQADIDHSRSKTHSVHFDHEEPRYGVRTAGGQTWIIEAVLPYRPFLNGNELRYEDGGTLCKVETPYGRTDLTVTVSISFRDIVPLVSGTMTPMRSPELQNNQQAVAAALFARRLNQTLDPDPEAYEDGARFVIARAQLQRTPDGEGEP